MNETLAALGLPGLPEAQVIGFVGHGMRRLLLSSLEAAAPGREGESIEPATAAFREAYGRGLLVRTRLHEGVGDLLRSLARAGARLSVLTNKPRVFTGPILEGLGVAGCFADAVCGDEVTRPKPDPEGLLRLVARSGIAPAETCLVGDSAVDVETAHRGGVASCAVTWGLREVAELRTAGPDHLVASPTEILARCALLPATGEGADPGRLVGRTESAAGAPGPPPRSNRN